MCYTTVALEEALLEWDCKVLRFQLRWTQALLTNVRLGTKFPSALIALAYYAAAKKKFYNIDTHLQPIIWGKIEHCKQRHLCQ